MIRMLNELFHYDEVFGKLRWKVNRGTAKAGSVAGSMQRGYLQIMVNGKNYLAHRIVWILHKGNIADEMQIDHINGIKDDNRLENLRVATRSINLQNRRCGSVDNKCGLLGVTSHRKKYQAKIFSGGKNHYLGSFTTAQEAHEAYVTAKRELHSGCTI